MLTTDLQDRLQQEILRLMVQQALTKIGQSAGVKARIIQWQRERIFPIQPSPHHLGGLAVGEVFQRLQDGDQRQSPRRFCGSSPFGKQMSKVGMLIDRAERISQIHGQRSLRKTRLSYSARQIGNGFERLGLQRHLDPPSCLHEQAPHDLFPSPLPSSSFLVHLSRQNFPAESFIHPP